MNKIAGMSHIYQRPPDIELAREALRDLIPPSTVRVSIDGIIRNVAEYYGVPVRDLMGKRRTKSIAFPRQVCMFLARKLTSHSLEEIGGYFGGRDHTTVMYAFDKIRQGCRRRRRPCADRRAHDQRIEHVAMRTSPLAPAFIRRG